MNRRVSDVLRGQLKNHSWDTYNSLSPTTWLLNIFAINSNVIKDASCSKFFYITKCLVAFMILGSLNISSLLYKNLYVYKYTQIAQSVVLTDTVQMVYDLLQYFVDLWFVHKYGRHISLEYFKQYGNIDAILGMTYYCKIKWELIRLLSVFTLIWLLTSSCDYVSWFFNYGWITPTTYMIAYIFLYLKILTTLDLSSHIIHIRYRLMIMGDIVHEYYSGTETLPGFTCTYLFRKNLLCGQVHESWRIIEQKHENIERLRSDEEITILTRCYLQLTEQVEFINCMFGFRILLNSLSLLIDIIRFTNLAVRIVLGSQQITHESRYFPAVCSMLRQMTCILVLVNLVSQAERAYRESYKIINTIDHLLINKNPSDKLRVALTKLRGLMQDRPINFNLANFFRLDYSLLVSTASVVVTYTIILLQSMN